MYYRTDISALLQDCRTEWVKRDNGKFFRLSVLVGDDGLALVQLQKLQDDFAHVRRVVVRTTISDGRFVVAVYSGGKWSYALRKKTPAPQLYSKLGSRTVDLTPTPVMPTVAALRQLVAHAFPTEGQFLDWLAYKSPHGWAVDAIHDLTEAQARTVLAGFEVGLHG